MSFQLRTDDINETRGLAEVLATELKDYVESYAGRMQLLGSQVQVTVLTQQGRLEVKELVVIGEHSFAVLCRSSEGQEQHLVMSATALQFSLELSPL